MLPDGGASIPHKGSSTDESSDRASRAPARSAAIARQCGPPAWLTDAVNASRGTPPAASRPHARHHAAGGAALPLLAVPGDAPEVPPALVVPQPERLARRTGRDRHHAD